MTYFIKPCFNIWSVIESLFTLELLLDAVQGIYVIIELLLLFITQWITIYFLNKQNEDILQLII